MLDTNYKKNLCKDDFKKYKLSFEEQIKHMKNKGIKFNEISENEALLFLQENTYYFKIKSFLKNFMKDANNEKYCNVDFYDLQLLSKLDLKMRYIIFIMTSSIEHYLKVEVNKFLTNDKTNDGYEMLKQFSDTDDILKSLDKRASTYTKDLIKKYSEEGFAIWNFCEVLTFGEFIKLYKFFSKNEIFKNNSNYKEIKGFLDVVRILRNVSAHNNCFINNIANRSDFKEKTNKNKMITNYVKQYIVDIFSKKSLDRNLSITCIHDFIVLLITFKIVSQKSSRIKEVKIQLKELLEQLNNLSIKFSKTEKLKTSLNFLKIFLENYLKDDIFSENYDNI